MKRLFTLFVLGLLSHGFGLSQQIPDLVAQHGYADMILVNGKIVTMDDWSVVPNTPGHIFQSMAIKGKKIMALGTDAEMRALAGPQTRVTDVRGKTVIPGLIQTHYHLFGSAASRYGPEVGLVDPSVRLTVVAEDSPEATSRKLRDSIVNAIRGAKHTRRRLDFGQAARRAGEFTRHEPHLALREFDQSKNHSVG